MPLNHLSRAMKIINVLERVITRGALVAAVCCCACSPLRQAGTADTAAVPPEPVAHISESAFDFGAVPAGKTVEHEFRLTNTSSGLVRIQGIQTSCACTIAEVPQDEIAPGESCAIPAALRTHGKSGRILQTFTCTLDDGSLHGFRFEGFVSAKQLGTISFGEVNRGSDKRIALVIPKYAKEPWALESVDCDTKLFDVTQTSNTNGEASFAIQLASDAPYGKLMSRIVFKSTDSLNPEKTVEVEGYVRYPVEVDPIDVAMGVVEVGKDSRARFRIYSPYEQAVHVDEIELVRGAPLEWVLTEASSTTYEVELTVASTSIHDPLLSSELRVTASVDGEAFSQSVFVYGLTSEKSIVQ